MPKKTKDFLNLSKHSKFHEIFDEYGNRIEGIKGISVYKDSLVIFTEKGIFANNPSLFKSEPPKANPNEKTNNQKKSPALWS